MNEIDRAANHLRQKVLRNNEDRWKYFWLGVAAGMGFVLLVLALIIGFMAASIYWG